METKAHQYPGEGKKTAQSDVMIRLLRPLAFFVIVAVSGCFAWVVQSKNPLMISTAFIVGGFVGLFSGMVAGVTIAETILTMSGITGLFFGTHWGLRSLGWVGIFGGPVGLIVGAVVSIPIMLVILFVIRLLAGSSENKDPCAEKPTGRAPHDKA